MYAHKLTREIYFKQTIGITHCQVPARKANLQSPNPDVDPRPRPFLLDKTLAQYSVGTGRSK